MVVQNKNSSLVFNAARSLVQAWTHHIQSSDLSTDVACSNDSDSDMESVTSDEEEAFRPWDNWATFVPEVGRPGEHHSSSCTASTEVLPLPCEPPDGRSGHRDIIGTSLYPDNLCVARLVGKAEI